MGAQPRLNIVELASKRRSEAQERTVNDAVMRVGSVLLGNAAARKLKDQNPTAYGVFCIVCGLIVVASGAAIIQKELKP